MSADRETLFASLTGSSNTAYFIEDGKRVYPCRCGETHRGDYGHYDWAHHNCLHRTPLWDLSEEMGEDRIRTYLMCPDCGEVFHVQVKA